MGFFKFFRRWKNKNKNNNLVAEVGGGEVTPTTHPPKQQLLTPRKLNNRLKIINQKLQDLRDQNAPQEQINHWEKNKEKVKALLWIYFDEE